MTTQPPSDPIPKRSISLDEFFTFLEARLCSACAGKTLLGEIAFTEENCDNVASAIKKLITRDGPWTGIERLITRWPFTLALWLVNEAFFHFASGAYWPPILKRIGINNVPIYSVRLGRAFVNFLEWQQLPRFRRLNTRWSYLGPLLAHAGIPRSCLPEFFEKVLPRAEECAAAEDDAGFEQLLVSLPSLYLTKPTERFLLFGEQIARDFLKRSVELRRLWLTNGTAYQKQRTTPLPDRVVLAFKEWTERSQSPAGVSTARRSLRRPVLRLDLLHGLVLELPSQRLESGESLLRWIVEPDAGISMKVESRSEPGQRVTAANEWFLPAPFASLKVRLISGNSELATWVIDGISRNKPVLFFAAEDLRVIPYRIVDAGSVGIAHPSEWRLVGTQNQKKWNHRILESLGLMPFGWRELDAKIYDLTDLERVELRNPDNQPTFKSN